MKKEIQEYILVWGVVLIWLAFCSAYFWIPSPLGLGISLVSMFFPILLTIMLLVIREDR